MASLGVPAKRVFLANYPDFSHADDGTLCDLSTPGALAVSWPQPVWAMFSDNSRLLNEHVARAGGRLGFAIVPVDQSAFAMRGYCSSRSLFVGLFSAAARDDVAGPFHPNREAHVIAMRATASRLCASLYKGDEKCGSASR